METRNYQKLAISKVFKALDNNRSVLLQMPCGTGKTFLIGAIIKEILSNQGIAKILIVAHRHELLNQIKQHLIDFKVEEERNLIINKIESKIILISSIQKEIDNIETDGVNFQYVLIDEGQHAEAKSYKKLWEKYEYAKFIGLTATPLRLDGKNLLDLFDEIIYSEPIKWFINEGYLSEIKYYATPTIDMDNVNISVNGEYNSDELMQIVVDNRIISNLLRSYKDIAENKKMIVFAVNKEHAKLITDQYQKAGYSAENIDSDTNENLRQQILCRFNSGTTKILVNVDIFTEGFDSPDTEVVQLARPTKSLALFLQQVGRVMRKSTSKEFGIILDNAGLYRNHGLPTTDYKWEDLKTKQPNQNEGLRKNKRYIHSYNVIPDEEDYKLYELVECETDDRYDDFNNNLILKNLPKIMDVNSEKLKHGKLQEEVNQLVKDIDSISNPELRMFANNLIESKKQEITEIENNKENRFNELISLLQQNTYDFLKQDFLFVEESDKQEFVKNIVLPFVEHIWIEIVYNLKEIDPPIIALFNPITEECKYENKLFATKYELIKYIHDSFKNYKHPIVEKSWLQLPDCKYKFFKKTTGSIINTLLKDFIEIE